MSAYAEELPAYITFKGYALGKCHLMYTTFPPVPGELPVWYGVASGSMALKGYAKASSYEEINNDVLAIYGSAYFTELGDIQTVGFLSVRWFENNQLHQLWIAIYSKPTSQGIFQPETDKFVAGIPPTELGVYPPGFEKLLLSYKGIYKIGSNSQYLSGPIVVSATEAEKPPLTGIEFVEVGLFFGEYAMMIGWFSETVTISWGPGTELTVPAARTLVRDVELL
jgi:hypothetical protein